MKTRSKVFHSGVYAGDLILDHSQYIFSYDRNYVANGGQAISFNLPTTQTTYVSAGALHPFFQNLLPEHGQLRLLVEALGVSSRDYLSLLEGCTVDGTGAVTVGEANNQPLGPILPDAIEEYRGIQHPRCHGTYVDVSEGLYDASFATLQGLQTDQYLPYRKSSFIDLIKAMNTNGTQLSGAQPKVSGSSLRSLSKGTTLDRHIIKFDGEKLAGAAQNEHLTMTLAHQFGINTCQNYLMRCADDGIAYVAVRFDRADNGLRLPMEDFAQLLNLSSEHKYSGDFMDGIDIIKAYSEYVKTDLIKYFDMVLFSAAAGNTDLHWKNLSMYNPGNGWQLTPAYDVLSVTMWPTRRSWQQGITFDGKNTPSRKNLTAIGLACGISHKVIDYRFDDCRQVLSNSTTLQRSYLSAQAKRDYTIGIEKNNRSILTGLQLG